MTYTGWNMIGRAATSFDVRASLPLLILLALGIPSQAAPPPAPASTRQPAEDFTIEVRVLRALRLDSRLQPLNLSVRISHGIAHLSGPVPSADLKQLAIRIAERVEGVLEVRATELYLSRSSQTAKPMRLHLEEDRPTQTRSASPHTLSSGVVPSPQSNSSFPVSPQSIDMAQTASAEPYRRAVPGQQITLLAPEASVAPPRQVEPGRLTARPRPTPAMVSPAAVERLRCRDARFQQIRVQVQGTTISIFPGETPFEDVMRFTQAVRSLPGVQHVIVAAGSR